MRILMSAGAAALAAMLAAAPSQAQSEAVMWCQATADNGADTTTYYSALFSAGAQEAERKAADFKSEVEDEQISAASVTAKCMASADYNAALAAQNAAMKAAPGRALAWEG